MKLRILFTVILLLNIGCSEEDFGEKKKKAEPVIQAKNIGSNEFSHLIEPTEEPNKYKLLISWPETTNQVEIEVEGKQLKRTRAGETFYSEIFDGGKNYRFSLTAIQNEFRLFRSTLEVKVPLDVILKGKQEISGLRKIVAKRLYIKKDAHLISYENSIEIEADEIFAEGGTLQNFPWGHQACTPSNWNGLTGGNISIKARRAFGELTIIMVGARGCSPMCFFGGHGGNLKVQVAEGENLQLSTQLLKALGSPANVTKDCSHRVGTQASTCISLSKDNENECFDN